MTREKRELLAAAASYCKLLDHADRRAICCGVAGVVRGTVCARWWDWSPVPFPLHRNIRRSEPAEFPIQSAHKGKKQVFRNVDQAAGAGWQARPIVRRDGRWKGHRVSCITKKHGQPGSEVWDAGIKPTAGRTRNRCWLDQRTSNRRQVERE